MDTSLVSSSNDHSCSHHGYPWTPRPDLGRLELDPPALAAWHHGLVARRELLLERYETLERVGEGGMGVVYRALDHRSGQLVALKLLKQPDGASLERFRLEAKLLAELEHPSIVRYLDQANTCEGDAILVLEWLEGETLAALLARRKLSPREVVTLGLRMASALALAHARGIVHRDIKPSNIIVGHEDLNQAKLLDFGIARLFGAQRAITQTGMILGTAGYMAPEQARSEAEIGPAADVFSLGCVLFESLTGRPAFRGHHAMALLAKLLFEEPARLGDLDPELPVALVELVERMLAKPVAARPADGDALWRCFVELGPLESERADRKPAAISSAERCFRSVVAIAPESEFALAETAMLDPRPATDLREAVERAVVPLGARVDVLLDGTLLIMLVDEQVQPRDQALRAARCALWARGSGKALALALVTGWSSAHGSAPVGELLDRAAELLALAPPPAERSNLGVILVDPATHDLIDERFEVHLEGERLVLRAERPLGDVSHLVLGRNSPFVGRERDLRNLVELVETSFDEREPMVALVVGEPGVGKSRLRQEIGPALREHEPELQIIVGRGDFMSRDSPMAMVGSLFRTALDIGEGEDRGRQREKIEFAAGVTVPASERARVAEFLGEMMGVHFSDEASPQLRAARQSPQIMVAQITRAYVEFVCGFAQIFSTVVLLDDLQWADTASLELVAAALGALQDSRYVVVAFARPEVDEHVAKLWARQRVQRISLAPLSRRASRELVRAILDSVAGERIEALVEHAGGNPLFLEELIRGHVEGHAEQLPATLLGMLDVRLAGLQGEARRVLRAASVFGESFWAAGLCELLDEPRAVVDAHLAALVGAELIVAHDQRRFAGQLEHGFRHVLMREGVYAKLTEHDRALAHARAATWLLDAGERDASVLAHHFELGGQLGRAIDFHTRAAEQALALSDFLGAQRRAERGLALTPEPERAAELWSVIAHASFWSREQDQAIAAAEQALASPPGSRCYCRALGDLIAAGLFRRGSASQPRRILDRLLATEPADEAIASLAFGFDAAMLYLVCVEPNEAVRQHVARLDVFTRRSPDDLLVRAWSENVRASWTRAIGAVGPAQRHSEAAAGYFEQVGHRYFLPYSYAYMAIDRVLLGDFESADALLERALRLAQSESVQGFVARHFASSSAYLQGHHERALAFADPNFAAADARGEQLPRLLAGLIQADVAIQRNELEQADAKLESIRSAAQWYPFQRTWYSTSLARLRLGQARLDEAQVALDEALELRRVLGRTHFQQVSALDLVHVELLRAGARDEQANATCERAVERLLARAQAIDDRELRRSFLDRMPDNAALLALASTR